MKTDKSKMFPVSLKVLNAEDGAPFPLYLFLKRNDRFIPIRLPGDPIGLKKYESLLQGKLDELWVPTDFKKIFENYLRYLEKTGTPIPEITQVPESEDNEPLKKSEQAQLVTDALEDDDLTAEEKAEVLSAVSQDMMRALKQITTRGNEARAEGLKRCKDVVDEVLTLAAKNSNIYDEIIALRSSQEDIEHSVLVGTLAAMFGMAIGYTDESLLADLTVGAIFHDIGLVRVQPEVIAKPEVQWTAEERNDYQKHVEASVDILKESEAKFHQRVFRMIAEHHENYDGSGFPKGLKGDAIDETSGLLHLANLFDRLCTGKHTGTDLSPAEAFDHIYEMKDDQSKAQEVQPELVERVFQFMLEEKEAAEAIKKETTARAQSAKNQEVS